MPDPFVYISADLGKTWTAMPANRELLGDGYQEFRRYTLSRRKHEHGRWRA